MPLLSLAAGVLPDHSAVTLIENAAAAGFDAAGVWYDADTWTDTTTEQVCQALQQHQLFALDIEPVWFHPGEDSNSHQHLVEVAKAIKARNILCVSTEPELIDTQRRFEQLCQKVAGTDINVTLEFLALSSIKTLDQA
ncbi:hypothetical protein [Oceanicoccus sp. KOV_DT_Chl]|uniref:hypothetical protein n=1 Tax=Oceanicoccus sp. KOV_DT_Chl TaxID=1904639 RepID=UPI000C7BD248|nr:hypothetical protein [Oceanicoccus sp. KOV_DT_Chl]